MSVSHNTHLHINKFLKLPQYPPNHSWCLRIGGLKVADVFMLHWQSSKTQDWHIDSDQDKTELVTVVKPQTNH